jgi:hypothetical protein
MTRKPFHDAACSVNARSTEQHNVCNINMLNQPSRNNQANAASSAADNIDAIALNDQLAHFMARYLCQLSQSTVLHDPSAGDRILNLARMMTVVQNG